MDKLFCKFLKIYGFLLWCACIYVLNVFDVVADIVIELLTL